MNRIEILREKITKLTGLLTDKKVVVTQRGMQAYVRYTKDGIPELVNIPFIPDNATQEFTQAIEGFLDHEVAHVLFTSGSIVVKADKLGVGGYHNAIEDIYIEGAMSRKFPGSKLNLETMHTLFIRDIIDANYKNNKHLPIQYLLVALLRGYSGQRAFEDYMADKMGIPEVIDVDKRLSAYCKKVLPNITSSQHALDITLEIVRLLKENKEPPKPKQPPPQEEPNKDKGEPNEGSGQTPEDEGQSGNSTKEEEEKNDEQSDSVDKQGNPDEDDAGKPQDKHNDDDTEADNDESSSPSNKEKSDNDSGDDDVDSDGDSDDTSSEGMDDGNSSDTRDADIDSDDEQGKLDEDEEEGEDEADGGGKGSGKDTEPEDQPAKDATGEDQADADGDKTKSEEGREGSENPSDEDESEDGDASGKGGEGDNTGDEPEDKSKDGEDAHQDLDMNASSPELPEIDVEALQTLLRDFDEAMSELITREAIEVAEHSDYIIYSRDFDVIEKFDIEKHGGINSDAVRLMEDKVDHMVGKIQRDLERAVSSQNKTQWAAGQRSGRLDTGSLNRLVKFGEEKVFKRKQVTKAKNAAISLLIDCSGSMHEYNKIATAAYTAYALSTTLERLGINHEVLGFTTTDAYTEEVFLESKKTGVEYSRYDNLYVPIFKPFGERLNSKSKAALASLATAKWLGNNVDGECVAIAASRLMQQKEERKILIVLSDGNPVCYGDKSQLRSHLRKTIKDITKSKIEVLGIGINDDAVKTYYPKHLVINRLADLPTIVMGQLRKFLTE